MEARTSELAQRVFPNGRNSARFRQQPDELLNSHILGTS
jgi:hypothetical protein